MERMKEILNGASAIALTVEVILLVQVVMKLVFIVLLFSLIAGHVSLLSDLRAGLN